MSSATATIASRPKTGKIAWIDASKGLGIYLVILGHVNANASLRHFIYLFHMPLFFFLSGYLHKAVPDLAAYGRKKSIHLLLPYLAFLIALYPIELVRAAMHLAPMHGFHHASHHAYTHSPTLIHAIVAGLWGGRELSGIYGVFWFLPCLFFTQQIMNFLLVRCRLAIVCLWVLAGLALSYANQAWMPQLDLPLDLNVVPAAMPFFLVGFLIARYGHRLRYGLFAVSALGTALGAYLVLQQAPVFYNMRESIYGVPGLSLLLSLCCTGSLIVIAMLSVQVGVLRKALTALGAASLGIMFVHKSLPIVPALARLSLTHGVAASLVLLLLSFAITWMLQRASWTRALFLGSERELYSLLEAAGRRRTPAAKWSPVASVKKVFPPQPAAESTVPSPPAPVAPRAG